MSRRSFAVIVTWTACVLLASVLRSAPAPLPARRPQAQPHPVGVWRGYEPKMREWFLIEFHPDGTYHQVDPAAGDRLSGRWRMHPRRHGVVQVSWPWLREMDERYWWRDNWCVTPGVVYWPHVESGSLERVGDLPRK